MSSPRSQLWTCSRCLRGQRLRGTALETWATARTRRPFSATALLQETTSHSNRERTNKSKDAGPDGDEQGAMSRRLAEMAEETIDTGSKSDRKLMKDVGFSDELKKQLEDRIAQTGFATQNQRAASEVNMPSSAGKGSRDIAGAQPWSGTESLHDSTLRMLDDSHKKLRSPYRPPSVPQKVSLRPAPKKTVSAADRLASARDKTSIYAFSQQNDMSEAEREKWRKELKDRFSPGARPMPTTLQGLTSLANERIEDAIARGQFKNIPRGKGTNVERDYNANSPFLDTTEYFMNKIIQKQEIVPPWIEKQQELVKAVNSFRGRLRSDWKRHAARMIASRGGSVDDQVRRAQGYALAEERVNPRAKKVESLSSISSDGSLTSITVEERITAGIPAETKAAAPAETDLECKSKQQGEGVEIKVTEQAAENVDSSPPPSTTKNTNTLTISTTTSTSTSASDPSSKSTPEVLPTPHPFRDPAWEKTELAYHTLAIQDLNALTRSYNLMAPKIAQKPYFTLARELNRCFADVAPLLGEEIRERSRRPAKAPGSAQPDGAGGVLGRFGEGVGMNKFRGHEGRIRDEGSEKGYGFRQFWRDLFARKDRERNVA